MEGGKPENPEKNPRSRNENQQQTQPTYGTGPESNPGHIGGRRALSPLHHPCSCYKVMCYMMRHLHLPQDVGDTDLVIEGSERLPGMKLSS